MSKVLITRVELKSESYPQLLERGNTIINICSKQLCKFGNHVLLLTSTYFATKVYIDSKRF